MANRTIKPEWKAKIDEAVNLYTVKRGENDCWLWEGPGGSRQAVIYLQSGGIRYSISVCRHLMGVLTARKRTHVFHTCKNPICVNPAHLSLKRPSERRRIWKEDVQLMRFLQRKGRSVRNIASCWDISVAAAHRYLTTDTAPEKPDERRDDARGG